MEINYKGQIYFVSESLYKLFSLTKQTGKLFAFTDRQLNVNAKENGNTLMFSVSDINETLK